jgi:hypothetical protein
MNPIYSYSGNNKCQMTQCPEGSRERQLSFGGLSWASSTRDFEIRLKGYLEVEQLSLWELCEGNLEGGLPSWGPWRIGRKGSGDRHLFP